jgi:ribose transport system permease protein
MSAAGSPEPLLARKESWWHEFDWFGTLQTLGPVVALVAIFLIFASKVPDSFATGRNIETILRQTAIVGIGAFGMTAIIIMGGIDLSAGSIVAFSSVVIAALLTWEGSYVSVFGWVVHVPVVTADWPAAWPLFAACAGVVAGALCGLANGLLITKLRVVPFIVTLGTLLIIRGWGKGLAHMQKIDAPATWLKSLGASVGGEQSWMLLPPGVWIMLVLALGVAGLLHYTRLGRHIFAVGSNEQTARLCGISVDRVKITVYMLGAACAGLAGLMQFSRLTVGDPTVAVGLELDIIAAVVIGGASLSGGEGSVLGSLVGALIMSTIRTGCNHLGIENWLQEIITGSILILAVALDRLRQRVTMDGLVWFYAPWIYAFRRKLSFTISEMLVFAFATGLTLLFIFRQQNEQSMGWLGGAIWVYLALHAQAVGFTAALERSQAADGRAAASPQARAFRITVYAVALALIFGGLAYYCQPISEA